MKFFEKHSSLKVWIPAFIFVVAVIFFEKALNIIPVVLGWAGAVLSALTPFVLGFVIAFVLYIPQSKLESVFLKSSKKFFKKHARGFSSAVTYIIFFCVIALLLYFVIPWLVSNMVDFVNNIPGYYEGIKDFIKGYLNSDGTLFGIDVMALLSSFSPAELLARVDVATLSDWAEGVFKVGSTVINVIMALVVSVYMLTGRRHLIRAGGHVLNLVISKQKLRSAYRFLNRVVDIFHNYIYSQVLDAMVFSIILSIVLTLIGVPYSVLFGVMVGVCNLIPYFGAIIAGAMVVLITLIIRGPLFALITAAAIIGVGQIDGNLIQPRIVGSRVGLRPIYVLLAITLGGGLFGFLGILIAVPCIATVRMILIEIMERRRPVIEADESLAAVPEEASAEKETGEGERPVPAAKENN